MTYSLLGQDLHNIADFAKKYFAQDYGATAFKREESFEDELPLRPTWQAKLKTGYSLCVNVQPTPFSPSLYEFVTKCAQRGIPVKLWVATPESSAISTFNADLRKAREIGIGVVHFSEKGSHHEYHRAVPLSLFALQKTDLKKVVKTRRECVKNHESTFLDGTPDLGCQGICQELEDVTRQFAEFTYNKGWWTTPKRKKPHKARFFQKDPWANVLRELENRLGVKYVQSKCPIFSKQLVVRARAYTDWRNSVSHKPRNRKDLQRRDARLRTMFEASRDILIDWYDVAKPFKLLN